MLYRIFTYFLLLFSIENCYSQQDTLLKQDVIFDITTYEPMRNRAIAAVQTKQLSKAKTILDSCYTLNNLDTMVIALLHETLLMQINQQKNPNKNLEDILSWESQYIFIKDDLKIQKIKIQDAVVLSMQAFDAKNFAQAEKYTRLIAHTIQKSEVPQQLKQIANVDAIFYNVGMQLFYDKKFIKSHEIFAFGRSFFPKDKDMETMYKLSKERLQQKK